MRLVVLLEGQGHGAGEEQLGGPSTIVLHTLTQRPVVTHPEQTRPQLSIALLLVDSAGGRVAGVVGGAAVSHLF